MQSFSDFENNQSSKLRLGALDDLVDFHAVIQVECRQTPIGERLWDHAKHHLAKFIGKFLTKAGIFLGAFWNELTDIHRNLDALSPFPLRCRHPGNSTA